MVARYSETRRADPGWGLVAQALGAAMGRVLADWQLMVAQLEGQLRAGKLTLQVRGGAGARACVCACVSLYGGRGQQKC